MQKRDDEIRNDPAYILGFSDGREEEKEKPLGYGEKLGFWLLMGFIFFVGILIGNWGR